MKKEKPTTTTKREPLSKKTRFEVFKRDNFTCQYCGRKAPDIILECEHIHPVKHNGKSNIINLITSCRDCNRGKGATLLSDHTELSKQRQQIEDLNIRRQQLEMMLSWKDELMDAGASDCELIADYISKKLDGKFHVGDLGKSKIRAFLKRSTASEIIDAIDKAHDSMSSKIAIFGVTKKTFEILWTIFTAILLRKTATPSEKKKYLRGIIYNRFEDSTYWDHAKVINDFIDKFPSDEQYDRILNLAKTCNSIRQFCTNVCEWEVN